jgi:predicted phosphate transport protein (TIGR00153 family)
MPGLFKRDETFLDLFERAARNILEGATVLAELINDLAQAEEKARRIRDLEHMGDNITHEGFTKLHKTFITPLDREDIRSLLTALDDIMDFIEAVAERLYLYKMAQAPAPLRDLSEILVKCGQEVLTAILLLKSRNRYKEIPPVLKRIHELENLGDRALRAALATLFEDVNNPIQVIKWKEIYENLETATDRCEDVANVLEGVALKHG